MVIYSLTKSLIQLFFHYFSSMIRSRLLFLALILSPFASMAPAHAHGSHGGGAELEAGEFDFTPIFLPLRVMLDLTTILKFQKSTMPLIF